MSSTSDATRQSHRDQKTHHQAHHQLHCHTATIQDDNRSVIYRNLHIPQFKRTCIDISAISARLHSRQNTLPE